MPDWERKPAEQGEPQRNHDQEQGDNCQQSVCRKAEKMLSARRKNRSEMRGMKIAGSTKSRASRMVTVGSVSQAGAEKSIDGLENHRIRNNAG